jgi:hypothetical protein
MSWRLRSQACYHHRPGLVIAPHSRTPDHAFLPRWPFHLVSCSGFRRGYLPTPETPCPGKAAGRPGNKHSGVLPDRYGVKPVKQ